MELTANPFSNVMGTRGFRNGEFEVTVDGEPFWFDTSVPHSLELEEQRQHIISNLEVALQNNPDPSKRAHFLRPREAKNA